MFTGALIGLVTSLVPEVVKYFNTRQELEHERKVLLLQGKFKKEGYDYRFDTLSEQNALAEVKILRDVDKPTGNPKIDIFKTLFRPITGYIVVGIWALVQLVEIGLILTVVQNPWSLDSVLNAFDEEVVSAVLVYYFNTRGLKRRFGDRA